MSKVTFVTNKICPFAHRVWISLLEKKVDFELKEVSLTNKEPYFTETYQKATFHDPISYSKKLNAF
jgi:glutathione S-transferase